MKKTFLTLTTLALIGSATGVEAASTTLILTDNVNIRTAATTSAPVITTLKKGTTVTAVKKTGSWYEIRHQSKKAFITAAYVKTVPAKAATTTTYITNTASVNVREKATTSSKSLGKLAKNVNLAVKKKTGDWYEITYQKKPAFVHTTLVTAKTSTVTTGSKPPVTTPVTPPASTAVKAVDSSKQYEVNAKEGLNARLSASTTGKIYKTLPHKTVLKVTGAVDSWYQVQLDGKNVYVASNYVLASAKETPPAPGVSVTPVDQSKAYKVNAPTGLNVRTAPSTTSTVFTQLAHGSSVQVSGETTGTSAGWYQIKIGTTYYYVAKSYITTGSVTSPVTPPVTPPAPTIPASGVMEKAISIGQKYLGTPYVWGSSSPVNGGFDCSGFINYTLNTAGYKVARTNVNGYWNNDGYLGQKLSKLRQPVRGDIIFFENTYAAGPTHIGIMLNNDQFIHANTPSLGISRLSERYWTQKLLGFKAL
ncbi:peptidoglycan endopeptidase [Exiguobacterium sp. RIT452]|uniref:C40 family peptidase n=1 Tax=Exiguobacterium sp. RIT452 TaxID=2315552 RepID=UPI000E746852|nr:SH3 domain-containing protein [Exiguobacterium sp. RIT452]RJP02146.1 peptidoglycan endopeptidase [Exiguobacterium sp. RIT452]